MSVVSPSMKNKKHTPLDGKTAWDACVQYGSIHHASRHLINETTGLPYTKSGVSRVAYEYALGHLAETRPQWEQIMRNEGQIPTEEAWKDWLRQKAHIVFYYRVARYKKFMADNNL